MSIVNKLNPVNPSSVAQLSRIQKTLAGDAGQYRQMVAEGGNSMPLAQQQELNETRRKELNKAIMHVAGYVQNITRELNFSIDEELGETIVRVIDEHTGDVIRQIPPEDMLKLARNLAEIKERSTRGLLFQGDA
jgi:flagellar protein FlaG